MKNSEYLSCCRNEIRRSKKWKSYKDNNYSDAWRRYIDLYSGRQYSSKSRNDQLVVNLIFSTINVMAPAVAINNPRFVVNARNPESQAQAIITEEVLNYLWRQHDYQKEFRLAVDDFLLTGHGWIKTGWKATKPPEEKKTDAPTDAVINENEGVEEGIDDRDDVPGNVESELNITNNDRPFIERISVFDMFVDPDCRHPKEMRWIAQRVWRPVQDVSVDSRYSPTQRKRVSAASWSRWDYEEGDARSGQEKPTQGAVSYGEIIEFYDVKRNKVCTFAMDGTGDNSEGDSGFLIKPGEIPYAQGQPFTMLRNYEVPDHFYPMGDVQQIESLQLELNETRTQMLNYRKKFRRAWVYNQDDFEQDGIRALESGVDNVMIPVTNSGGNPGDSIAPLPTVITPPEFFDQSAMISNDLDRVSGVSDYQRGAQTAIKRTATEAAMIQDAANARAQDRLGKIELVLSQIAEQIVGIMQQYLNDDHVGRIVTMPVKGWFKYDKDRIKGQFDFDVQGGSTEPQNETFRRQSALQIVDASMPFMEAGIVKMPALYQELLSKGFGIKDSARFVTQPQEQGPPGMEQQGPPQPGQPPPGQQGQPPPGMQGPPPGMPGPGGQGQMPQEITPEMMAQMMVDQQGPPPDIPPEMLEAMLAGSGGLPPSP